MEISGLNSFNIYSNYKVLPQKNLNFCGKTGYKQPQKIAVLNKNSNGSKFFGVDSYANIYAQILNHCSLIKLMEKDKGIKTHIIEPATVNLDDELCLKKRKFMLWNGYKPRHAPKNSLTNAISELRKAGAARFNISGSAFGNCAHTIGLVTDNKTNTLYILDSLGEHNPQMKAYHKKLKNLFDGKEYFHPEKDETQKPFNRILFNNTSQQSLDEYTCNNWTIANIEALINALNKGQKISCKEALDNILPKNINKILEAQKKYVLENEFIL